MCRNGTKTRNGSICASSNISFIRGAAVSRVDQVAGIDVALRITPENGAYTRLKDSISSSVHMVPLTGPWLAWLRSCAGVVRILLGETESD